VNEILLSYSRIAAYLSCPEKYRLHYVEKWRRRRPKAGLVFGSVVHEAVAAYLATGQHSFDELWEEQRHTEIEYGKGESFDALRAKGILIEEMFISRFHEWMLRILGLEQRFEMEIDDGIRLVGIVDFIGKDADGRPLLLDWKTARSAYPDDRTMLDMQLSYYSLLTGISKVGFCVFVKTTSPRIQLTTAEREPEQVLAAEAVARHVARCVREGIFHQTPHFITCQMCDYRCLCTGDTESTERDLVQEAKLPQKDTSKN
jgi:RecB family exonuclease